jgi:hypothetical protein
MPHRRPDRVHRGLQRRRCGLCGDLRIHDHSLLERTFENKVPKLDGCVPRGG